MSSGASTASKETLKKTTEGEALKVDFSSSIGSLFPPLFKFLELFGPDRVFWLGVIFVLHLLYYTAAPRCLLFLLPYPLVYLMPMYMSMAALQRAEEPKLRAFWLSYWACLVGMDLVEMAVLGTWAQALLYWPGVKVAVALFLLMETADFSVEPKIDPDLEKKLKTELRAKRRVWTAERIDKYKIRSDENKIKEQNKKELEKSRRRPRRFHAYMLVQPFLPDKAHAGGKEVYFRTDPPAKKYDKYGMEEKSREEKRNDIRDALLDKAERRTEAFKKAGGLGNWMEPVMELNGKVYDHNPMTDEYGNIAAAHDRGDASETPYGTPWDSEPDHLTSTTVKRGDVPADSHDPHRAKDVHRIKFGPDVDHRHFATDYAETTGFSFQPENMRAVDRLREEGDPRFQGHPEHKTTEIANLNSTRRGLRESATDDMLKNRV